MQVDSKGSHRLAIGKCLVTPPFLVNITPSYPDRLGILGADVPEESHRE